MFSQFTIQIMSFYLLTRVFSATNSTIAVSLLWIAGGLPSLMFGPFSGSIVDNFSKRTLMLIANLAQAVVVCLPLFVAGKVFPLYLVVFLYWLLDQVYYPSQQSIAVQVVEPDHLPQANGLFLITQQISVIVGFGLGGVLHSLVGDFGVIAICSFNLLIASLANYFLPKDQPLKSKSSQTMVEFMQDLDQGFKFVKSHREISLPLLLIIAVQVFIAIITISAPSYTQDVLHENLNAASIRLIIPGALGALLIIYLLPKLTANYRKKLIIQSGLLSGGISVILLGLLSILPTGFRQPLASIIAIGMGVAVTAVAIPAQSILQQKTPADLLGRVFGQLSFLLNIATTIPLFFAASVIDIIGISLTMIILGLLLLAGHLFIKHRGDYVLSNGFRF